MSDGVVKKEEKEYEAQYYVVKNHEEQYSIWPTYKPIPRGWESVGKAGNKENCLNYIDEVWADMRPLSLRKKMEEIESKKKDGRTHNKIAIEKPPKINEYAKKNKRTKK